MKTPNNPKSGFTLVELLVVIAVLSILIAIIYPMVGRGLEMARDSQCRRNLKSIGDGFLAFAFDHEGILPGNVAGPAYANPEWKRSWLGDEVLRAGDNFPSHWIPARVQSDGKGTTYSYIGLKGDAARRVYLCPSTLKGKGYGTAGYGLGIGSNERFDYTSLHAFMGAHTENLPLTAEVVTTPRGSTVMKSIPTPLMIEEDSFSWANKLPNIEPGAGNQDFMGLHHRGYSNYFAIDGSVQHMAWTFADRGNRPGVFVGPSMNHLRTRTPSGALVHLTGTSGFGGWNTR